MKNMSWLGFVVCGISISAQMAVAGPSGVLPLPSDVVIPQIKSSRGVQTLPVALWPGDEAGERVIYVQPLEGIVEGPPKILKSPRLSCANVSSYIEGAKRVEQLAAMRGVEVAKNTEAYFLNREKHYDDYLRANKAKVETIASKVKTKSFKEKVEYFEHLVKVKNAEIFVLERQRLTETDPDLMNEIDTQLGRLHEELKDFRGKARECELAFGNACDIETLTAQIEAEISEKANSAKIAYEGGVALDRVYTNVIEKEGVSASVKIAAASRAFGGYLKLKINMAPTDYLVKLKEANPGYTFKWVPSMGGGVDITFPKATQSSAVVTGKLILDQKWDVAPDSWKNSTNPFFPEPPVSDAPENSTLSDNLGIEDHGVMTQRMADQDSGSLADAKQLTLKLSELGICAILEPDASLIGAPQSRGENAKEFALTMFYSFPLHFDVAVDGKVNQAVVLHDLYKHKKSSSGFGLSRSEKIEFSRTFTDAAGIDIRVRSRYPLFDAGNAMALDQSIRDQIAFSTLVKQGLLTLDKSIPIVTQGDMSDVLGAPKLDGKMTLFPNPWVQVSGLNWKRLDSMFGRSQQETEKTMGESRVQTIDINTGFTMPVAAGMTFGSMTVDDIVVKDRANMDLLFDLFRSKIIGH